MRLLLFVLLSAFCLSSYARNYYNTIGVVDDTADIQRLTSILESGSTSDTMTIYITSPGGRVDIMNNIIDALAHTDVKVTCVVNKVAASAATFIALEGCRNHTLIISPTAVFLFHYPFTCFDMSCSVKIPFTGFMRLKYLYKFKSLGIFTKAELDEMYYNNVDLQLSGKTIVERMHANNTE